MDKENYVSKIIKLKKKELNKLNKIYKNEIRKIKEKCMILAKKIDKNKKEYNLIINKLIKKNDDIELCFRIKKNLIENKYQNKINKILNDKYYIEIEGDIIELNKDDLRDIDENLYCVTQKGYMIPEKPLLISSFDENGKCTKNFENAKTNTLLYFYYDLNGISAIYGNKKNIYMIQSYETKKNYVINKKAFKNLSPINLKNFIF
jgi:hypothetical protein